MIHFDHGRTWGKPAYFLDDWVWEGFLKGMTEYKRMGWRKQHGFSAFHVLVCFGGLLAMLARSFCIQVLFYVPQTWSRALLLFFFRFDGRVVAKLPFIPLSYIQGLSHRNLLGEDYTDCSFIFLYILCTMSIRQVSTSLSFACLEQRKHMKYSLSIIIPEC